MTGHWVKRKADEHVCAKPKYEESGDGTVSSGDLWVCDICGSIWEVYSVWRGDQREPLEPGERPAILWNDSKWLT